MPEIDILNPIDQQFIEITDPLYWGEITIPGTLKKAYKNLGHYFPWSFAVISGAPVFLMGEAKISGQGYDFPFGFPDGWYYTNDQWVNTGATFSTPDDWVTLSIEIYFKVISRYNKECTVSFKDFKLMVTPPGKTQYLPIVGVG